MGVKAINSEEEFDALMRSGKLFIVDFWATWCGPCRVISPILEKLSEAPDFNGKIEFYKVDVDEQEAISQKVGIRAMPTFVVYKDREKVDELVGANPTALESLLTKFV